jgi:beta-glucosidase
LLHALRTGRVLPPIGSGRLSRALRDSCDFFGLNYYTRERVAFDPRVAGQLFGRRFTPPDVEQSDVGFEGRTFGEIYPGGLYRALRRVARLGLPIYITETGLPDADDDQRPRFILSHLAAAHRALQEGVDLRGVFFWTLVDNFEWAEGWGLRFGLYALDRSTQERRLRRSGALYAAFARANAIP